MSTSRLLDDAYFPSKYTNGDGDPAGAVYSALAIVFMFTSWFSQPLELVALEYPGQGGGLPTPDMPSTEFPDHSNMSVLESRSAVAPPENSIEDLVFRNFHRRIYSRLMWHSDRETEPGQGEPIQQTGPPVV